MRRGPLVIAHRGASGYRPEHTLAAYRLAIGMGADFVEPDLVSTRDGVLVARHENEISGTTDVAARREFADRLTTKVIDGARLTGWFTEDFTLAELKTLRAVERLPGLRRHNTRYDGQFAVPTFDEVLELVAREGRRRGEVVGVCPETKSPSYFDSIGLPLEPRLAAALRRHDLDRPNAEVFVQSFEARNLRELRSMVRVPLVRLVRRPGQVTPAALEQMAEYAAGVGPAKALVLPRGASGVLGRPTTLVADAHSLGLLVHVWTMRDENEFLPADLRVGRTGGAKGHAQAEYRAFFDAGVDGVFTDHADTARRAVHGSGPPAYAEGPTVEGSGHTSGIRIHATM